MATRIRVAETKTHEEHRLLLSVLFRTQTDVLPMNMLGISAFYHESAAALLQDGHIVAAAQEGRLTRKKHAFRFPQHAADHCLSEGGLGQFCSARDVRSIPASGRAAIVLP